MFSPGLKLSRHSCQDQNTTPRSIDLGICSNRLTLRVDEVISSVVQFGGAMTSCSGGSNVSQHRPKISQVPVNTFHSSGSAPPSLRPLYVLTAALCLTSMKRCSVADESRISVSDDGANKNVDGTCRDTKRTHRACDCVWMKRLCSI